MTELMALSIVTGVLCGLWSQFAPLFGLIVWAGFAGCTTYFASPKSGMSAVWQTIRQNLFGVFAGTCIIYFSTKFDLSINDFLFSGFFTFVMCIGGKYDLLSFIPGTFVGCFSTFASGGNIKVLIPTLIAGAFLGVACDLGGKKFYELVNKKSSI